MELISKDSLFDEAFKIISTNKSKANSLRQSLLQNNNHNEDLNLKTIQFLGEVEYDLNSLYDILRDLKISYNDMPNNLIHSSFKNKIKKENEKNDKEFNDYSKIINKLKAPSKTYYITSNKFENNSERNNNDNNSNFIDNSNNNNDNNKDYFINSCPRPEKYRNMSLNSYEGNWNLNLSPLSNKLNSIINKKDNKKDEEFRNYINDKNPKDKIKEKNIVENDLPFKRQFKLNFDYDTYLTDYSLNKTNRNEPNSNERNSDYNVPGQNLNLSDLKNENNYDNKNNNNKNSNYNYDNKNYNYDNKNNNFDNKNYNYDNNKSYNYDNNNNNYNTSNSNSNPNFVDNKKYSIKKPLDTENMFTFGLPKNNQNNQNNQNSNNDYVITFNPNRYQTNNNNNLYVKNQEYNDSNQSMSPRNKYSYNNFINNKYNNENINNNNNNLEEEKKEILNKIIPEVFQDKRKLYLLKSELGDDVEEKLLNGNISEEDLLKVAQILKNNQDNNKGKKFFPKKKFNQPNDKLLLKELLKDKRYSYREFPRGWTSTKDYFVNNGTASLNNRKEKKY